MLDAHREVSRLHLVDTRPRAAFVLPGAGTMLLVLMAFMEVVLTKVAGAAFGGTSGGALVALFLASGRTPGEGVALLTELLQRRDLLDKGWPFDDSPGLYRGERIARFMRQVFGAMKMKDLKTHVRVTAWDASAERGIVIDSKRQPDLDVWRVAMIVMSIEGFFDLRALRPDNPKRMYGDGGLIMNCPFGIYDDLKTIPTIGVRFAHQQPTFDLEDMIAAAEHDYAKVSRVVDTWKELAPAAAAAAMRTACSSWPSRKGKDFHEVVLHVTGDALAFGIDQAECARRVAGGRLEGQRALTYLLGATA